MIAVIFEVWPKEGCLDAYLSEDAVVRAAFMAEGRLVILPSQVMRVDGEKAALMFIERTSPRTQRIYGWLKDALRYHMNTPVKENKALTQNTA